MFCDGSPDDADFKKLWKLDVPQCLRLFTWLSRKEALLMNANRYRRGKTNDGSCDECHDTQEIVLHVLRDCKIAKEIRMSIGGRVCNNQLFAKLLCEWLD